MNQPTLLPLCKIFPYRIICYYESDKNRIYREDQGNNLKVDRIKTYKGKISDCAKRKISERLACWSYMCILFNKNLKNNTLVNQRKLVFITLTLSEPQRHSDLYIKEKLLEMFLKRVKDTKGTLNYFWKAEKQKNGNIHFHLIVDVYLDKDWIRHTWNICQKFYGYTREYEKKFKNDNPPSTHVQMVNSGKLSTRYLLKYVSKQDSNVDFKGRIYSFSDSLLNLKMPVFVVDSFTSDFIDRLKLATHVSYYNEEFFSVINFSSELNIFDDRFFAPDNIHDAFYNMMVVLFIDEANIDILIKKSELNIDFNTTFLPPLLSDPIATVGF